MLPGLIDLASESVCGAALAASDDFFAPKETLTKARDPLFIAGNKNRIERRAMQPDLIDLASESERGEVFAASDDFSSPKENRIKAADPVLLADKYTEPKGESCNQA